MCISSKAVHRSATQFLSSTVTASAHTRASIITTTAHLSTRTRLYAHAHTWVIPNNTGAEHAHGHHQNSKASVHAHPHHAQQHHAVGPSHTLGVRLSLVVFCGMPVFRIWLSLGLVVLTFNHVCDSVCLLQTYNICHVHTHIDRAHTHRPYVASNCSPSP